MYDEETFLNMCQNSYCPRNTAKVKSCSSEFRQKRCYEKYLDKLGKDKEKRKIQTEEYKEDREKRLTLKSQVEKRDKDCLVLKILTNQEFQYITDNYRGSLFKLKRKDMAHILEQSKYPEFSFDLDNVFLCSRYFHELLDNFQDLITHEYIGREGKERWITRIMQGNLLWSKDTNFEKFYNAKLNRDT